MRERMENHAPVATPQSAAAAAAAHIPWRRRRALGLTLKSQKNCAFFTADFSTGQPRQAPATVALRHRRRRRLASALQRWRGGEGGGLENFSCATAPFYCAAGRLHRAPHFFVYLMQWKTNQVQAGGKMALKTLFLKRERRHFFAPWLAQYPILMAGDLTKTCLESHKEN